jgi:hypothetical protein
MLNTFQGTFWIYCKSHMIYLWFHLWDVLHLLIFIHWLTLISLEYITKSNLQIKCHQNTNGILHRTRKNSTKVQRPWIAKAIIKNKSNGGGIKKFNFKLYYRAIAAKQHGTGIKTDTKTSGIEWGAQKSTHRVTAMLFLTKGPKHTWMEDNLFNIWC